MSPKDYSRAAKLDVVAAAIVFMCMIAVAIALEISAPIVAGLGAFGAVAVGITRVAYSDRR